MNWQPVALKAVVDQIGKVAADLTAHQHIFEETFRSAAEAAKYFSLASERLRNTNKNLSGHGFFLFPYLDDFDISDIDRLAEFSATELAAFLQRPSVQIIIGVCATFLISSASPPIRGEKGPA